MRQLEGMERYLWAENYLLELQKIQEKENRGLIEVTLIRILEEDLIDFINIIILWLIILI